jgi:hypothetical protein
MHFLVIDNRFSLSPVYVFLEGDPREDVEFPGLPVHQVTLQRRPASFGCEGAIGQNLADAARFEEFRSDRAIAAGYELVEPRYVGPTWTSYARAFPREPK